jgi:hypothetical protein
VTEVEAAERCAACKGPVQEEHKHAPAVVAQVVLHSGQHCTPCEQPNSSVPEMSPRTKIVRHSAFFHARSGDLRQPNTDAFIAHRSYDSSKRVASGGVVRGSLSAFLRMGH